MTLILIYPIIIWIVVECLHPYFHMCLNLRGVKLLLFTINVISSFSGGIGIFLSNNNITKTYRYIFKDGKRCDLQELGPRFTLKLKSLQKGIYDPKNGEYEWLHKVHLVFMFFLFVA